MQKYRNESGFIDLNKIVTQKSTIPCFDGFCFDYEETKYYFKRVNKMFVFHEMMGFEIAKEFGLNAVEYDVAFDGEDVGNLSKNFYKPTMLYLETLLTNYYGEAVDSCNLNDVMILFNERFPVDIRYRLEKQLVDLLMFDLIIDNHDRHSRNIMIDMKTKSLGPIFDNELMLTKAIYDGKYYFSLFGPDENTLDVFMNYMDEDTVKRFVDKVELINKGNIEKYIQRIEEKIGAPIDIVVKNLMVKKFEVQYAFLQDKIKEYKIRRRLILGLGDNNA